MRQKIKKIILILMAFMMLAPTASVYADAPTEADHQLVLTAQNKIAEESIALLYLSNYYNCIYVRQEHGSGSNADYDHPYSYFRNPGNNNWWDDFLGDYGPYDVGYWFENELGAVNDTIDGQAYCQEFGELQQKVADLLTDGNVDRLLCGEDIYDPNGGGIIYNKKAGSDSHFCGSMDDDNHRLNAKAGYGAVDWRWQTWFESLFNAKAAAAEWTDFTYEDVTRRYFNGIVGYYLYRQELIYKCGEPQIATSLPSGFQVTDPLKTVAEDGGIDDAYFPNEFSFKHGFVSRMDDTMCKTVVGFANEDEKYAAYRDRVLEIFNNDCKTYYNNEITSLGDNASDEAKAKIDELNASTALNPWLEEKEASRQSMQCVSIPDMVKPTEVVDDPADTATEDACNDAKSEDCREKACYKAAGSLGWVICPVIFTTRDAVNGIYDGVIEPLLMVDPAVIASLGTNDSPTYKIWATFRNLANILFAIVLLAVILSQVTGFGIDNYGIKKILPKLIVTAILVNLSLIICGVLVDAFNLLGGGIKQLFDSLSSSVNVNWLTQYMGDSDPTLTRVNVIGTVLAYALGLLVVGGGTAVGVGLYTGGIALSSLIIPILLLVLSGIIAAFFAFVILGARQALIIIMISISPLAFVLYALPNTQGIFKKWLKIFEGLLLVYPAASLLIGGGYLASRLILSNISANPFMAMIAGLVSIVPYFMIPKLTSKSMDALGGIGNAINGVSRGSRNRATNGINNSEAVKRRRQAGIDAAHARNANRYLNSRRGQRDLQTVREGHGNNLSRARRARLANALQNSNSEYETNKGILDSAQLRDNVASGAQTEVDAFNRTQADANLAHTFNERDAMATSAELKRQTEHYANEYADVTGNDTLRNAMTRLLGEDPELRRTESKAQFAAIMDRQKAIDPKGYAALARHIIDHGNTGAKQELKNHMSNNEDIASKFGLKQVLKEGAGNMSTSMQMQDHQAAKDTKSLLAMDDDLIQSYRGLASVSEADLDDNQRAIVQNMTRAADEILTNPKMAEGLNTESLNTIARVATGDSGMTWNNFKQKAANDTITIGGEVFRRSKLPSTKDIENVNNHVITYKDGSKYNADTGELTIPPHNPNPNPNPNPGPNP